MTHATNRAPRLAAISAAAALLLAGCSTGHIGESWQCPLAEGGTCDSVAAADPAVPDVDSARNRVLGDPLWRVRGDELGETSPARGPGQAAKTPCVMACGPAFDPFGWLARLFGSGEAADRAGPGNAMAAAAGPPLANPSAPRGAAGEAEPAASSAAPKVTGPEAEDPATALFPAEPEPAPDAGDLRTDEVVARIWIAPFVDADGVYREASHVRVVLEPAGWRLK